MHIVIWEFIVLEAHHDKFVDAYGSSGEWVTMFRHGKGYVGTDLLRSEEDPTRFLTIDRWENVAAFERFREAFAAEYEALDKRLQGLSSNEKMIGIFSAI